MWGFSLGAALLLGTRHLSKGTGFSGARKVAFEDSLLARWLLSALVFLGREWGCQSVGEVSSRC